MQYLTRMEQNRVQLHAGGELKRRELTPIEKVIQRLPGVYSIPVNTVESAAKRSAAVQKVMDDLFKLTMTPRLGNKVKEALVDPLALNSFMDTYQHAKYEAMIEAGGPLSNLERMAIDRFEMKDLQLILQWIARLHVLFGKLPKGVDTFIWTPETKRWKTREMAVTTGDKAYYGWLLPEAVQESVDKLFDFESVKQYARGEPAWMLTHARRYDVANIPDVWKRAELEDVREDFVYDDLKINFIHPKGPDGGWLPAQLEMKQPSSNTRLRFFIPADHGMTL